MQGNRNSEVDEGRNEAGGESAKQQEDEPSLEDERRRESDHQHDDGQQYQHVLKSEMGKNGLLLARYRDVCSRYPR